MEIKKTDLGWEVGLAVFDTEEEAIAYRDGSHDEPLPAHLHIDLETTQAEVREPDSFECFIYNFMTDNADYPSITAVSDKLGVSRETLYSWMRGKSLPSGKHCGTIKALTGCSADELFDALSTNFIRLAAERTGATEEKVESTFSKKKEAA